MFGLKNDTITQFWATPIFQGTFENTNELNRALEKLILGKEQTILAEKDGARPSLLFNQFSTLRFDQQFADWDDEAIPMFHQMVLPSVARYLQHRGNKAKEMFEIKSWVNIHRYGDWHGTHSHFSGGGEIASGVYWVKVPPQIIDNEQLGGRLLLFDPRGPFFPEREKVVIVPEQGKMILFPSWLQHEVTPMMTDELRISIAFDVHRL